jgi:hypothetical protein
MPIKNRVELKGFFAKNAVPSADNFVDLIESALNQQDDGIQKIRGEPLRLQGEGDAKRVINFYTGDAKPAWALSLHPAWSIGDADGTGRVSIEPAGSVRILQVLDKPQDANGGGALALGKLNASNLRLGYHTDYTWIQSHGGKPLQLNPAGNGVGVGITSAPRAKLEVGGGAIMAAAGGAGFGILFSPNPGGGADDSAWIRYYARKDEGEACTLELGVGNDPDDHIALMPSGNVGIGLARPGHKLHVAGGNAVVSNTFIGDVGHGAEYAGLSHSSSATTAGYGFLQNSNGQYTLINKKSGGGWIGFRVDNGDKMVINDAGDVGIGTTTPKSKLEVAGPVMERLEVIKCGQRGDWRTSASHPIMQYFKSKLSGMPVGTYLRAIQDHTSWRGHYWEGWVDCDGKVRVIHNFENTPQVAT